VLTAAVVAPAILTNASSVLGLGTNNRLVVDRTRVVYADLARSVTDSMEYSEWMEQLEARRLRGRRLLRTLRLFYAALGLSPLRRSCRWVAPLPHFTDRRAYFEVAAGLAVMIGASAVIALITGCTLMVHETRIAVQSLTKEGEVWKRQQPSTGLRAFKRGEMMTIEAV